MVSWSVWFVANEKPAEVAATEKKKARSTAAAAAGSMNRCGGNSSVDILMGHKVHKAEEFIKMSPGRRGQREGGRVVQKRGKQ